MHYSKTPLLISFLLIAFIHLNTQTFDFLNFNNPKKDYIECAAILYKGNTLANRSIPGRKYQLEEGMEGKLSVSTVSLSETSRTPLEPIKFHVALKNIQYNTFYLLTKSAVMEIELKDILEQRKSGERIIFLTDDKRYSLTHHEIEIMGGC